MNKLHDYLKVIQLIAEYILDNNHIQPTVDTFIVMVQIFVLEMLKDELRALGSILRRFETSSP